MNNPVFKETDTDFKFIFENGFVYNVSKQTLYNDETFDDWLQHLQAKTWFGKTQEVAFTLSAIEHIKNFKDE